MFTCPMIVTKTIEISYYCPFKELVIIKKMSLQNNKLQEKQQTHFHLCEKV